MKKLLLKIFVLTFIVASVIFLSFFLPISANDPGYISAIIDKHARLQSLPSPCIILIGGSGVAFGSDSKLIEQEMKMPAVNMGLHAGFGLRYNLSEIKPFIKKDDVIVIIPEYDNFFGSYFDGSEELAELFLDFPESRKYLESPKQYGDILQNYPYALRVRLFSLMTGGRFISTPGYNRKIFNEYGDVVMYLNGPSRFSGQSASYEFNGEMNKDVIPYLNDFNFYAEKRGAKVFFIYPAMVDSMYKKNEDKIKHISGILVKQVKIPVLSNPLDYVFPESFFYDTVYHLNAEGRKIRTQRIIADLKKAL